MILAIDVGNTHTSFGCVDEQGRVEKILRIKTDQSETPYGYAASFRNVLTLAGYRIEDLEGAILSCVVPPLAEVLREAARILIGKDPMAVGAGLKTGLPICTDDPGTVASDLVATAVAAKEEYPLPCVIVDMGTAGTVTVVDEKGRFIGGAILPGAGISLAALTERTSLLPRIEILPPKKAIASSTVECMRSGILYGAAGAIDGILDRFAEEIGREPASIVCTGSLAGAICPHCRHAMREDETLLLRGLGILYRRNRKYSA